MKFTFLIPSKNRIDLLAHAVESILRQDYQDFEIIISDNASEQDYASFVEKIGDDRIIYKRSPVPVSVTQNWNNALQLASGDYILMLGDDDALTPDFLPKVVEVISEMGQPDILYFASYHYAYPNVMPSAPNGYLADVRNSEFFKESDKPFQLSSNQAQQVAKAIFDIRYLFGFNSQHFLFRAAFIEEIASSSIGSIFQSPYPDTFASAVTFLKADSIVVIPHPMVIIGISPKSFGYYYYNNLSDEGAEFLDNELVSTEVRCALEEFLLPGNSNNTNWLVAAEVARQALSPEFDLTVNVDRYRALQIVAFLRDIYINKVRNHNDIEKLSLKLSQSEDLSLNTILITLDIVEEAHIESIFDELDKKLEQFCPAEINMLEIGRHDNVVDAFNWLAGQREPAITVQHSSTRRWYRRFFTKQ